MREQAAVGGDSLATIERSAHMLRPAICGELVQQTAHCRELADAQGER